MKAFLFNDKYLNESKEKTKQKCKKNETTCVFLYVILFLNGNFLLKGLLCHQGIKALHFVTSWLHEGLEKKETTFVFLAQTWQHLSSSAEACYVPLHYRNSTIP